jgi:topoisomerase-4 subunit B
VVDVVSKMNTGGKYDSLALKKSVGLNGVEPKQSMPSNYFRVESVRDDKQKQPNSQREFGLRRRLLIQQKRKGTKVTLFQTKILRITNSEMM